MDLLKTLWFYPAAFIFSAIIADLTIRPIQTKLRKILEANYPDKEASRIVPILPQILGLIERVLYVTALYIKEPLFVGFWLTLKAASRWETWAKDKKKRIPGRAYFNIFLTGNALSIIFSFAGYGIILWGENQQIEENFILLIAPVFVVASSITLNFFLLYQIKNLPKEKRGNE